VEKFMLDLSMFNIFSKKKLKNIFTETCIINLAQSTIHKMEPNKILRDLTGKDFDLNDLKNYKIEKDDKFKLVCSWNSLISPRNLISAVNFENDNITEALNKIENQEMKRLMMELIDILQLEPSFKSLARIGLLYRSNYLIGIINDSADNDTGIDFNICSYKIKEQSDRTLYSYIEGKMPLIIGFIGGVAIFFVAKGIIELTE
jgi:hypothetical protein